MSPPCGEFLNHYFEEMKASKNLKTPGENIIEFFLGALGVLAVKNLYNRQDAKSAKKECGDVLNLPQY
jgi:hypothetical protein